jgi:hypothetical protein
LEGEDVKRIYKMIVTILAVVGVVYIGFGGFIKDKIYTALGDGNRNGVSQGKVTDEESARRYIEQIHQNAENKNALADSMTFELKGSGEAGGEHYYRFQYMLDDIEIYGDSVSVLADDEGNVTDLIDVEEVTIQTLEEKKITKDDAEDQAIQYMTENYGCTAESVECSDATQMYYIKSGSAIPAYQYNTAGQTEKHQLYGKKLLVSAVDGEILSEQETICYAQESGSYKGQLQQQNITYENVFSKCTMENQDANITVYQPEDEQNYFWYQVGEHYIESWGKGSANPEATAVDASANVGKVVGFYENMVGFKALTGSKNVDLNGGPINTYVNVVNPANEDTSLSDPGDAFFWETPEENSLLAFTQRTNGNAQYSAEIDIVGHEFTHGVFERIVHPIGTEGDALNEAYGDILGMCAESYITGDVIDWTMSDIRVMSNSSITNYDQINEETESHEGSKLITYAAYLMSQGFDTEECSKEETKIADTQSITDLWIRSLIRLPQSCGYTDCSQAVRKAAERLEVEGKLTEAQKECVRLAFEQVGLGEEAETNTDSKTNTKTETNTDSKTNAETGTETETEKKQAERDETLDEVFGEYLEKTLIPEYGVMDTKKVEKTVSQTTSVWLEKSDFEGIIAANIYDYDKDGKSELLVIRGTCEDVGTDQKISSGEDDGVRLHMEMYECKVENQNAKLELADAREFIPCGKYRVNYHEVWTSFFTYTYQDGVYIAVDSNFRMNETVTTLALYQYSDGKFSYVKGLCRQRQGAGYEAVLSADQEPEGKKITFASGYTTGTESVWNVLQDYDGENSGDTQETADKYKKELDDLYASELEKIGLEAQDQRLEWAYSEDGVTEIYTAKSKDLTMLSTIATNTSYDEDVIYHLYRKDWMLSMKKYR